MDVVIPNTGLQKVTCYVINVVVKELRARFPWQERIFHMLLSSNGQSCIPSNYVPTIFLKLRDFEKVEDKCLHSKADMILLLL